MNARPRILRILTRMNVGGPARHVTLLAEGMREGWETVLVAGVPGPGEGSLEEEARRRGVIPLRLPSLGRGIRPLGDLAALWRLWRLCRELRPGLVHTHTSKAGALGRIAARLAGVPVVCHTFHGHVFRGYFSAPVSKALVLLERALGLLADRIYAVSPSQREDLVALGIAPPAKLRTLPLGLDLDPLAAPLPRGLLRRELGIPDEAVLVGCVARLAPIKDHATLLAAFSRLDRKDAHLVLIGDGPERARIEAEARRLPRVHLLGFREDLRSIYGDLDLAVLSSRNEGSPVALIEAASAGVPIVATRVGGVGDLLEGHPGARLCPAGDPEAFAATLKEALSDLPRLREFSRDGASGFRKRFGIARLLGDLEGDYRELLPLTAPPGAAQ